MAAAPVTPSPSTNNSAASTAASSDPFGCNTDHLKRIPPRRDERDRIRCHCEQLASTSDRPHRLTTAVLMDRADQTLQALGMPRDYLGWTMVILASAFWRDQFAAVPPERRLLLLPHCLKHAETCEAPYDEFGLHCLGCGACDIATYRETAEKMGYKVMVAEGAPLVMQIIMNGEVDAVLGVACLAVLEKAIDKVLMSGLPCIAIPLLSDQCRKTKVDGDWVRQMITLQPTKPARIIGGYVQLMQLAGSIFEPRRLEQLVPRRRTRAVLPDQADDQGDQGEHLDPIAATEAIAYDFLGKGGKYSRPFITLAVYDALGQDRATGNQTGNEAGSGSISRAKISDAVLRCAMSIESFHKASLVHDDIEDDDPFRYGVPTLHRRYGIATAINVGDYLIGMGYRLVSRQARDLGPDTVSDILDCLADAHMKLTEGQGAELVWRDSTDKQVSPIDALKIYALKTAPAFEAAILVGLRLAGPLDTYLEPVRRFARNLGVAFQILNDLDDWDRDHTNKVSAGGDVLGGRPTVLWALALDATPPNERIALRALVQPSSQPDDACIEQVRMLYEKTGVFRKASQLVQKHRKRAQAVADEIEPESLRHLFHFMIDTVLHRQTCVVR